MTIVALRRESATLVALTEHDPSIDGASNVTTEPVPFSDPHVADQATASSLVPDTDATNSTASPAYRLADNGSIDTETTSTSTGALPLADGSSTLVAVTTYEPATAGAVYATVLPVPSSDPLVADHVTDGSFAPSTLAVNATDWPSNRLTEAGTRFTKTSATKMTAVALADGSATVVIKGIKFKDGIHEEARAA